MSDDEYVIGDDSSSAPEFSPGPAAPLLVSVLTESCEMCREMLPTFKVEQRGYDRLLISVPSSILPLSLSVANRFNMHPVLVDVDLTLSNNSFRAPAHINDVSNPYLGPSFGGWALVVDRLAGFFTPRFRPKPDYRCKVYILSPVGNASDRAIAQLVQEGFPLDAAQRALVLTRGDVKKAEDFLMTGATSFQAPDMLYEYEDCPLIYLIFEICDAFFNLIDHCCMCGSDLGVQGVKLSLCSKPMCVFAFRDIGVGASVIAELGRDPSAADLVISLASLSTNPWAAYAAQNPTYANMKDASADLPVALLEKNPQFWERLPAVGQMLSMGTDANLVQAIGRSYYEILRGILLSNRTHLIHLTDQLKIRECAKETDQFLVVISSPERELAFRQKKAQYGAHWLWHGSPPTSWLSILQNGLGLAAQGIVWHAALSTVSFGYSGKGGVIANKYKGSRYNGALSLIGLVESVKGPGLQGSGQVYTQRDLQGLNLRCLMVIKSQWAWDTVQNPPKFVPTLRDCLRDIAKQGLHT
jgi:hypothetical protein